MHFLVVLLVALPHTKFEVSSFRRYRDIEGVPKVTLLVSPNFTLFVKFNLFDILAKFCDDSFIGCQEIR